MGEDDGRLGETPANLRQLLQAQVHRRGAGAEAALQDVDIGPFPQAEEPLTHGRVPRVGYHPVLQPYLEAEALQAWAMLHLHRLEVESIHGPLQAIGHLQVATRWPLLLGSREDPPVDALHQILHPRRANDEKLLAAGAQLGVFEVKERETQDVVAVEVGDKDDPDGLEVPAQALEMGQQGRRSVEEVAAVQEKAAPVAAAGSEGVARAEKGQLQHDVLLSLIVTLREAKGL